MKKLFALLLVLAMMLSMFSCAFNKSDDPADDSQDSADSTDGTDHTLPDGVVAFKKSDIQNIKLVYYRDIGDDAKAAVDDLVEKINSLCETSITVTNDFLVADDKNRQEWEHEILVGATNREESAAFGEAYSPYDYGYGYLDGKIVIYSKNDVFLTNAVNAFLLNVVIKNSKSDIFYRSDWSDLVTYDYPVDRLSVNGADVRDYEIVYPASPSLFEEELANRLQCYIAEMTGCELAVKKDSDPRETDRAFLIGRTNGSSDLTAASLSGHEGCVSSNGTDIAVYGNTMTGMVNASKHLTDLLFGSDSTEGELNVNVSGETKIGIIENHYSTMTFNVFTGNMNAARIDRVIANIMRYLPDTVGIQEANATWMNALRMNFSDYYGIVGEGRDGGNKGEAVPILYAKDRYDLIESGTKWLTDTPDVPSKMPGAQYTRNFTWALLEDKETKVRYLHLNIHLDTAGTEIRYAEAVMLMQFLQQYNDVAVVLTGDMNARIDSAEMKLLRSYKLTTIADYPDHAGQAMVNNMIDWILLSSDCITMTKHVTDDVIYNGDYSSDHYAFYAEIRLDLPEDGRIDHKWDVEPSVYPDEWLGVSMDKVGTYYGSPLRLSAVDRDANGCVEIPENALTVEIDGTVYVVIRSVEELNAALTADTAHANSYILDADLDYTGKTFQRIVLDKGIFDGNGHKMYGYELNYTGPGGKETGISTFANVNGASRITIRNLTIGTSGSPVKISTETAGSSIGAILADSRCQQTVENVTVYADLESKALENTATMVGGLIGFSVNATLTMRNCNFYGSVTDPQGGYSGGLIGQILNGKATIEKCANHGTIQSGVFAGGLIGTVRGKGTSYYTNLTNCFNYGRILKAKQAGCIVGNVDAYTGSLTLQGCENHSILSITSVSAPLGGMIGSLGGTPSSVTVKNCVNFESITGTNNTGGIIGLITATPMSVTVQDCINHGAVKGGSTAGIIGGINAKDCALSVEACLNFGAITGSNIGGMIGWLEGTGTRSVTGSANLGRLTGTNAGGLIGHNKVTSLTLTSCASFAIVEGTKNQSAIIATQTETAAVSASELVATAVENDSSAETIVRTTVTADEALAWMNTQFADALGAFILNSDGDSVVLATPEFVAIQKAVDATTADAIRLIGSVAGNTLRYSSVGFEIVLENGMPTKLETEKLHRKLYYTNGEGTKEEISSGALGGVFVYAVTVGDLIPAEGSLVLSVTAFAADLDGETVYRGETYALSFENGELVSVSIA